MRFFLTVLVAIAAFPLHAYPQSANDRNDTDTESHVAYLESRIITKIKYSELEYALRADSETYSVFEKSKGTRTAAGVFGTVGGFGIGWCAGYYISGGHKKRPESLRVNNGILFAGLSSLAVGIALQLSSHSTVKKAVNIYNSNIYREIDHYRKKSSVSMNFGVTSYGALGIELTF